METVRTLERMVPTERWVMVGGPVTAGTVVGCGLAAGPGSAALGAALAVWAAAVALAAVCDAYSSRVPDEIVALGMVLALVGAVLQGPGALVQAMVGGLLLAIPLLGAHLVRPLGMGLGDVKFGFLIGAGVGLLAPMLAVLALMAAVLLQPLLVLLRCWPAQRAHGPGTGTPFGPSLAISAIGAVIITGGMT